MRFRLASNVKSKKPATDPVAGFSSVGALVLVVGPE